MKYHFAEILLIICVFLLFLLLTKPCEPPKPVLNMNPPLCIDSSVYQCVRCGQPNTLYHYIFSRANARSEIIREVKIQQKSTFRRRENTKIHNQQSQTTTTK